MKSTFAHHHQISRTLIACLIISLMILSPLAPMASGAPSFSKRVKAAPAMDPAAPVVPGVTATKTDSFPDPDTDGKAAPGETITYDVNITNSGTDATGVNFIDTIDPNTTLVGGSLKVSPLAFPDVYSAAKDTPLVVGAPGVLTNDTGLPAPTAVPIAAGPTTQGGTVTLNADGSFTYNPAAGFEGADSFTYTATNGLSPNDTALVTINVDAAPSVASTTPTNGATDQGQNTNITVTFSEPVDVTGNWFQIVCATSGTRNVADTVVTGGPTTFTINPNVDFAITESCTVTVFAAQVTDQDLNDPPDQMAANFVFSFTTAAVELAPTVDATTPTNGAVNQATNSNVTVTFSEPVNVTGNWFQIVCGTSGTRNVADTVVTGGPTTFTINPNADFAGGETCTVTIFAAQVTDQDSSDPPDNMAANFVFSFSMDAAPTVNATTPTNGATQVANNTNVTITFSEPVDVTGNWFQLVGATSGTRNVADTVVTGGPTTFTINPNVDFANGELVTVTVFAAQVTDQDGGDPPDNMAANFVFSFTIDQAPSVSSTTPTNGATNQALNSNVSITFSEPVNVTGNWFQIVCANSGTRNVADTVVTGGPTTFTINPNADFTPNETCTVTVFAAQVTDQDSGDPPDNMTANFVFSFTTIDLAPTVTATTPTNGALNQTTNIDISVTFSEPVNVTGNWFQIVCGTSGTRNVADTVVTGGPTTFNINPNVDFASGESCTVTIFAAQVADQDSNDPPDNMAANFVFSFSMDAAPTVNATTPTNGATQVANNTNVTITFSEPVDVTGNWFQLVGATSGTRNVADTVVTGGPTTFTINPNVDFTNGEVVTVTVFAAQVSDQDSADPPQNMAANFVFSFTIDQAPSVTSTVPTNNATDVLKTSNIVVNFSENVTATTSSFTIECPTGSARAFTVSGSGTNQVTLDPTLDLPQGQICTVTVIANQISDTDAGDPPDNMLANFVFSFGVKPEAVDDARNATGNIRIQTAGRSDFSVIGNDISAIAVTVTTADTTSLRGGQVAVAANGSFTYNPPAGYEGSDSFNYTISNVAGSDIGTVNITITGMLWFVNTAAGSCTTINGSCGRLTNPFSTLAAFEAANGNVTPVVNGDVTSPEAGDHLFIFSGSYPGPLTLEANQRVIGQGATTGTLAALSGVTPATDSDALPATGGTKPSITTSGFNVVANNQLYGLAFDDTTNTAINSNANVGTLIIGDVTILNDASNGAGIVLDDGGTSVTTVGTNSINTRSAVALSLTNATNIGAAGLTFTTISAGNNDGNTDPANGIVLNNTGASGGLTVSGGTIRFTTASGVMLTSTRNINFSNFTVQNSADDGITGLNITNFTMATSTISSNGNAVLDRGIEMTNLLGTSSITGSTITGNTEDNLYVKNGTGTSTLTVSTTTISNNSATLGNDGIHFLGADVSGSNNANMSLTVTNCTFNNNRGDHLQVLTDAVSSATMTLVFQNNSLTGDGGSTLGGDDLGGGITLNPSGTANVSFNISNNGQSSGTPTNQPWTGSVVSPITINSSSNSTMSGTINNNRIGNAAVVDSGSSQGDGINITANNSSDITVAITNNQIRQYANLAGLNLSVVDGTVDTLNATITGNTISNPGSLASNGIFAQAGATATDTSFMCIDIGGAGALANSIAGSGANGGTDFRVRQRFSTTVRLPGYAGGATDTAAVVAFIQGRNTGAETGSATVQAPGAGFVGGAACATAFALSLPALLNQRDNLARTNNTAKPANDNTAQPSDIRQSSENASQTFSHHVQTAKRDSGTVASYSHSNSWVKSPTAKVLQDKTPRRGIIVKPGIRTLSGETVSHSVGTLLAGKTVHIQFQVTVNNPYLGGATVSNQGTVSGSNFSDVLTDDPAVGGANDPTTTPILLIPNVSAADAQANEPASGSAPMLFVVSLSAPAPAAGASVHYETADQPVGPGHAVAGIDYEAVPVTPLNFAGGEQFKTVVVNILADGSSPEPDETFLLKLSNATNAIIVDTDAVGTIKQGNAAGTFLISEFRTSGPAGDGDEFVELYNNTDSPLTVAASDASAGYGLFKKGVNCSATPILIGTIPNGTVIPARGHYLFVGSAYSLANYGGTGAAAGDQTLSADIDPDTNFGIFNTASVANISSTTRLDAVGLSGQLGANCLLLSEGVTVTPPVASVLEYSFHRDQCGKKGNPAIFGPCTSGGFPVDTNDNANDFVYTDTSGTATPQGQRLGAPGPENSGNPLVRNNTIGTLLLDSNIGAPAPPNRVRDLTPGTNAANGTLSVRRRFVNNTGAPVTRLRFRIVDFSSIAVPGGIADLRALTSTNVTVNGVTDSATCLAANGVPTTPCTVVVLGTTLETPPAQPLGGALNSTMSAGTITLATPLANGASINLQFLLGVQQTGSFKFFFNIEALP